MKNKSILITGGAGFIGSAFVRLLLNRDYPRNMAKGLSPQTKGLSPKGTDPEVNARGAVPKLIIVDKLTYAGDLKRLQGLSPKGTDPEVNTKGTVPDFKFYKTDICDKSKIESIFKKEKPDTVVNFAASTHVDRSIIDATPFIVTNVKGTQVLLDLARKCKIKKFVHISTDEVYGEIKKGKFSEDSPLKPNSPYAASKASADLLIKAYIRTYNFPAIIVRPCNNYGPWQYPEKLIPLAILKILKNQKVPVYGNGQNIREWLYVSDCAEAITLILEKGRIGEIYNIGSGQEKKNIDVIKQILKILGKPESLIEFVKDRPGHDIRYSLNTRKAKNDLSWQAKVKFENGIERTIKWYIENRNKNSLSDIRKVYNEGF